MVETTEIALVRHGDYDLVSGHLTNEGELQADEAAAELVWGQRFLGAVILTSTEPRAVDTAYHIGDEVGIGNGVVIVPHAALEIAGKHPSVMQNLRVMTRAILESEVPDIDYNGHLVVVTHMPLVAALMGVEFAGYGSVHYYQGNGDNPEYEPGAEEALEGILEIPHV